MEDHIFYLKVENDICSAKVTALSHPYHRQYHVLFENGYENIFFTDVETGQWIEEDLGDTALAANFGMKIDSLQDFYAAALKPLAWCRAAVAEQIICFGFHTYTAGNETFFEVYASNHKFLYLFHNSEDRWKVYDQFSLLKAGQYNNLVKIIASILRELKSSL